MKIVSTLKELNALVAEKVMGWHKVWLRGYSSNYFIGGHFDTYDEAFQALSESEKLEGMKPVLRWAEGDGGTFTGEDDWTPSTDMSVAWEVIEHMFQEGFYGEVNNCFSQCRFWEKKKSTFSDAFYVNHDDLKFAICLAALKVKGVEVELKLEG